MLITLGLLAEGIIEYPEAFARGCTINILVHRGNTFTRRTRNGKENSNKISVVVPTIKDFSPDFALSNHNHYGPKRKAAYSACQTLTYKS
jgi:hypothetical protein